MDDSLGSSTALVIKLLVILRSRNHKKFHISKFLRMNHLALIWLYMLKKFFVNNEWK